MDFRISGALCAGFSPFCWCFYGDGGGSARKVSLSIYSLSIFYSKSMKCLHLQFLKKHVYFNTEIQL